MDGCANLVAAWSLPDYSAGEARRRDCVCFPDGFSIKASLCIDVYVLVSTMCSVSLVDSPPISLGDQARVTGGVLNERVPSLISCH